MSRLMRRKIYLYLLIILCTLSSQVAYAYPVLEKTQDVINLIRKHQDKTLILNAFASFCSACKQEVPILNKLRETYASSTLIYGLALDEYKETLDAFVKETNMTYPVFIIPFPVAEEIGIGIIPQIFIYKQGKLVKHLVGLTSYDELEKYIK